MLRLAYPAIFIGQSPGRLHLHNLDLTCGTPVHWFIGSCLRRIARFWLSRLKNQRKAGRSSRSCALRGLQRARSIWKPRTRCIRSYAGNCATSPYFRYTTCSQLPEVAIISISPLLRSRLVTANPDAAGSNYIFLPQYENRATAARTIARQFNALLEETRLKKIRFCGLSARSKRSAAIY